MSKGTLIQGISPDYISVEVRGWLKFKILSWLLKDDRRFKAKRLG